MKKLIALVVMVAGIMAVGTACGVAQEDFDAAQATITRLEAEHDINHELLETLEATDLGAVLLATAKYQDEAVALADGYVSTVECVQAPPGSMGIHYVNPVLLEGTPDLLKPQILLYLPSDSGLKLIGVEWVAVALADTDDGPAPWFGDEAPDSWISSAPSLLGKTFEGPMAGHGPEDPWHYDSHFWLWEDNPTGMFSDFNPTVHCPE